MLGPEDYQLNHFVRKFVIKFRSNMTYVLDLKKKTLT